ncbi:hypothetical protein OH768_43640 [Streptomyces sp. NBC_01622]|uniref:hypothetical protein n=1 Tax=Streptomyces sp. NBC_01622 TaxID=2975903 RepID=UPI00386F0EAE|nr:hypothetical protein OH768_43640 [Streptomyces sp. NBC_01622]
MRAEAAERARRERAVTVRACLAVLATSEDRRTDELHHLTRDGAGPAARGEALRRLAAPREEAAERYEELAALEPGTAGAHHDAAAQAHDRADVSIGWGAGFRRCP